MNIVICDDDANMVGILHNKVLSVMSDNGQTCSIKELYDGKELLKYCRENIPDIVIADIDMPNMSGFEAVQELQKQQPDLAVVFISAHKEYACQSYDYRPFWFIDKMELNKFEDVISRLVRKINIQKTKKEVIYLHGDKKYSVNVNEIMYLKSNRHYILAYNADGTVLNYRFPIKEAYTQLAKEGFIQIQRGCIVNCRFIERFEPRAVFLYTQEKIKLTRNEEMLNEAKKLYGKFMRDSRC